VLCVKAAGLAHDFIEQQGDDSAVEKSGTALVFIAELKTSDDTLACVILFERKLHAARVCATAAKAPVFGLGIKFHLAPGFPFLARTRSTGCSLRSLDLASPNCYQNLSERIYHAVLANPG